MKEIGALATIFDAQGRVLLVHQTYDGNKWAWPGGGVEPNESPWDAAVREVKEETGLEVEIARLVSVYHFTDRNGLGFQFLCRVVGGQLHADGAEISEARFFDPAELPMPMTQPARQRLADALAQCADPFLREYDRVEIIQAAR
ncbi:MAG: NUDIX domain-containing protein [Chloroflexi bacterium]|nr:NUDIX domain-containing protein [Chloroflexota bacterium]